VKPATRLCDFYPEQTFPEFWRSTVKKLLLTLGAAGAMLALPAWAQDAAAPVANKGDDAFLMISFCFRHPDVHCQDSRCSMAAWYARKICCLS
jgi:hypothetical protein